MYLLKMGLICKNQLLVQKNTLENTDTKQKVFVYSSYRVFYKVHCWPYNEAVVLLGISSG